MYRTLEDYEKILNEIPYDIIEQHLKRRKEDVEDSWECERGW